MEKTISKNRGGRIFTGVAGEHFVAAEISRLGGIATLTSKNTPAYDIIASNGDGTKTAIIQVKTGRGETGGFIVGSREMPHYPDHAFHIFVLIKDHAHPEYWIIPSNTVSRVAEEDYQYWLIGRSESSKAAPRTMLWKHLRSSEFDQYHGNWNQLGVFDT